MAARSRWQLYALTYLGLLALALLLYLVASWPGSRDTLTPAERSYLSRRDKPLRVVGYPAIPPHSFEAHPGHPSGYHAELAEMLAQELGVKVEYRLLSHQETLKALEEGEADLVVGNLGSLKAQGLHSSDPFLPISLVAVLSRDLKESAETLGFGGRAVVYRSSAQLETFLPEGDDPLLIPAAGPREALEIMAVGLAQVWIEDGWLARQIIEDEGLGDRFHLLPLEQVADGYVFGAREEEASLLPLVNKALSSLSRQGRLEQLDLKWMGEALPRPADASLLGFFLLMGLVILAGVLLGFLVLNDSWRSRLKKAEEETQRAWKRLRFQEDQAQEMVEEMAVVLSRMADSADPYAEGHSQRVASLAEITARAMGLPQELVRTVRLAGLLHDVGKIKLPQHVFTQRNPLSWQDWTLVKLHPQLGAELLNEVGGLSQVVDIVRYHHERWDGFTGGDYSGYPGLHSGSGIPLGARIVAVADAYDAMTSTRSFRKPLPAQEALRRIRRGSGSQFDPRVVEAFCSLDIEGTEGKILAFPEVS